MTPKLALKWILVLQTRLMALKLARNGKPGRGPDVMCQEAITTGI
jgi:hypothetical protein